MKRNVSVVRFKFRCNILIGGKIIKEMPGSVASGTPCTNTLSLTWKFYIIFISGQYISAIQEIHIKILGFDLILKNKSRSIRENA